jgi:hypothetical protein
MAATYAQIAAQRRDPTFIDQVTTAVMKAALNILTAEAQNVANHIMRVKWAQVAIVNPDQVALSMAAAVLGDGTIQSQIPTCTDAQVDYVVNVMIDAFSSIISR